MFHRKKHEMMYDDVATNKLLNSGVYSVYKPDMAEEKRIFKRREHNILAGIGYVFIFSCLLWWLPLFGQMIAGYIGGRKAGSPIKGVMVAVIPVFILFLIFVGMDQGYLPFLGAVVGIPSTIMTGVQSFSPSAASYLSGIYVSLKSLVGLNSNGFFIIVVFGLIGGMMADMNKKEIIHAGGNQHFYDALFGKFSGASLNKLADMVAERVIWTLNTIDYGGRNLIGRMHSEPSAIGFEDLRKLPTTSPAFTLPAHNGGLTSYQSEKAFAYDAHDAQPSHEGEFEQMRKIAPKAPPHRIQPRNEKQNSLEENWGISHRDLSEESLTKDWKEHKRIIDGGKSGRNYRRDINNAPEELYSKKMPIKSNQKEKSDAEIYDNEGNLLNKSESKRKGTSKNLKQKVPSLVSRALAADEEVNAKASEEMEPTDNLQHKKDRSRSVRTKTSQPYDRL